MMKAADLCASAGELVGGDREDTHGSKKRNHENIARLWQAYLESREDTSTPLSALDALHMMVLLKVARTQLGAFNLDDYVDMIGYGACGGEVASETALKSLEATLDSTPGLPSRVITEPNTAIGVSLNAARAAARVPDSNPVPLVPRRNGDGT